MHSTPLPDVAIVIRNQSTGAEWRATTGRNGAYRFAGIAPGSYSLRAENRGGQLDDIVVAAGHESHVLAAMDVRPEAAVERHLTVAASPSISAAPPLVPNKPVIPAEPTVSAAPAALSAIATLPAAISLPVAPRSRTSLQPERPVVTRFIAAEPERAQALPESAIDRAAQLAPRPVEIAGAVGLRPALSLPLGRLAQPAPRAMPAAAAGRSVAERAAVLEPDPVSTAVTTTLTGEQLQSLPTSGRHWQDLFLDTPAAAPSAASGQLALRGAGQDPADTTIDGASTRLAFGNPSVYGSGGSGAALSAQDPAAESQGEGSAGFSGGRGLAVSAAAIREVQIVAGNVEAEGAHAAGGRAGVETESGANALHGQGFFSDRQNTWGAQNPFTQWVQNTGTAAAPNFASLPFTPPDHEMSWGLGAGGRIRRDRLFWFAAFDGYRRNDPGLASVKDFAELFAPVEPTTPAIVLLSAQLDESENQAYNDFMGIPRSGIAGAGLEQLAGLLGPAPRTAAQWLGFARLDWQVSERHRLTLEGTGANWNSPGGGLTRVSESYGSHSFGSSQAQQQWLLGRWEAYLTPNLLAVSQGSAGREVLSAHADQPSSFEQGLLGSGWNAYGQLPQIVVDSRYGFTIGNPSRFGQGSYPDEHMIHAQEMVDWIHGRLLVKAGFELDHNSDATTLLRNQTGSYSYSKVQDFIADALVFQEFGAAPSNFQNQHNCNPANNGLGALPCYSYFSQVMGPTFWQVSTNDWAGYTSAQWQLNKLAVLSAGLRWELEQLPPPIQLVDNSALPLTERLPSLGSQWGPRVSLAVGNGKHWPVVRLGYGMYFGRTENATLETALTQTGSLKGDLSFFIRPTDGYSSATNTSIAPPFPHVLAGSPGSVVVPGAVEYAPNFRNPEVHQALAAVEQQLPGRVTVTASAVVSLGRRLPVSIDTNFDPAVNPGTITYNVTDKTGLGPIKAARITVPFYALWPSADCGSSLRNVAGQCGRVNPSYQQITEIESRANSTYEAAMLRFTRYGERGLSLHAHYTYAHAMDWNPNETTTTAGSDVLDPANFGLEYGTGNLDMRHSAAVMLMYEAPWKLHGLAGRFANGWMLSGIGQFHSGLPYTMRVTGAIPRELDTYGNPTIVGLGPGMNGSGGDSRVYGMGSDGRNYDIGRNTFRYPDAWKADMRVGKRFSLGDQRDLELLVESFNLLNHQNVTEISTTGYEIESGSAGSLPTLNYLTVGTTGTEATTPSFGQPFNINATNYYRERQIQLGARLRF